MRRTLRQSERCTRNTFSNQLLRQFDCFGSGNFDNREVPQSRSANKAANVVIRHPDMRQALGIRTFSLQSYQTSFSNKSYHLLCSNLYTQPCPPPCWSGINGVDNCKASKSALNSEFFPTSTQNTFHIVFSSISISI